MKFGKIELSDWTLRQLSNFKHPDLIRYEGHIIRVVLYTDRQNMIEDVVFLGCLHDLRPLFYNFYPAETINWDINFAKQTVDAFLIKMNNLRAFL